MAEVTDIITKLLERTNEDKVSWQTTADEDTYAAVVGDMSALVSARAARFADQDVSFRVLNSQGREIARYDTGTSGDFNIVGRLRELHSSARRVALMVDSQLDELLKALEG